MALAEEAETKTSCTRKTVVVGVKLENSSRELLTWALVKVAQPGDLVIALHVLNNNDVVDRDGKSCLLSLVKQFDSVIAVYEGLCNLKQVDLKLKICRGESVRKILIREAISYHATDLILGTAKVHHPMYSSVSVAKYCAKKLGKVSSVLAVNNGKIVYRRGASSVSYVSGTEHHHRGGLLNAIHRTLSKNSKVVNDGFSSKAMTVFVHANHEDIDLGTVKSGSETSGSVLTQKCAVCPSHSTKESIVPIQKLEASSLVTLLMRELPEVKPGWPLLRRALSSKRHISIVQCSIRFPNRPPLPIKCSDENECPSSRELEGLHEKYLTTCRLFSYGELQSATTNFMPDNIVGKGGSSQVYRGNLPDGKEIAVKILKPSDNALKEFALEIEIITTLHHKNIISLSGFCYERGQLLLVYDLLSRGSLEENLHGNKKDPVLFGWDERYKVALGVAEALNYLHNKNDRPVIHRDVKSSNILLSDDYEPQLSDFGLAKWAAEGTTSHITCTDVAGTFGYMAPEYFMYGKVNDKIDVYAFGVVLLELVSGRKPISSDYPKGHESLVIWAKPILSCGKFTRLLDHNLGNNYDWEHLERMVLAAALCIRRSPRARPQMSIVLKLLHGDIDIIKWARIQVNFVDGSQTRLPFSSLEDVNDVETISRSNMQSHLSLALLGVEEDSLSITSTEPSLGLDNYLKTRRNPSISSSFD